jgi:hypothetical protein
VTDTTTVAGLTAAEEDLARSLMERAKAEGVSLVGPGGLLSGLTKTVLETALEAELTEDLGYEPNDPAGRNSGNSRNGTRSKTVLTEVGPVEIDVPRDRNGTFEPKLVRKRQRRMTGIDDLVISLVAKGLTTGEVAAHLAEVYGAEVTKDTISRITDRVLDGLAEWQNRPLDAQTGSFCETHRSSRSPTVRRADFDGRSVSSAATRWASRLVPWTVRLTCLGRPRSSRPVKARTSHTPGRFSRIVAMKATIQ